MFLFYVYLLFFLLLSFFSLILLFPILLRRNLRNKYSLLTVKFLVDLVCSICLLCFAILDRVASDLCGAVAVFEAAIPILQSFLLLSEVVEWWFSCFHPVKFHSSSALSRFIPSLVGTTISCSLIIVIVILAASRSCVAVSQTVAATFALSLAATAVSVLALLILSSRHRHSNFFPALIFHSVTSLLLQLLPLIILVSLIYSDGNAVAGAVAATHLCGATRSIAHSLFFMHSNHDCLEGVKSTFLRRCIASP